MSEGLQQPATTANSLRGRVLRGAFWTTSTTTLLVPVQVVQLALLGRLLGVAGFGRYALLQTVAVTAVGLSDLGVTDVLSRRGARASAAAGMTEVQDAARQLATWYLLRAWIPLVPLALLMPARSLAVYALASLVNVAGLSAAAMLTMTSQYRASSLVKVVSQLLFTLVAVLLASRNASSSDVLATGTLVANLVGTAVLLGVPKGLRLQLLLPRRPRLSRSDFRISVGAFSLGQLELYVFGRTELFFFDASQELQRGLYAAGQSVAARSTLVLDASFGPLPTALADAHARGTEAFSRAVDQVLVSTTVLVRCVAPVLLVLSVLLPPVLLGPEYRRALVLTAVLTAVSLLQTVCLVHGALRFALGAYGSAVPIASCAVVLDVGLCVLLVPRIGAAGAVVAASSSGIAYLSANMFWLSRLLPALRLRQHFQRNAALIGASALAAAMLAHTTLLWQSVAAGLALGWGALEVVRTGQLAAWRASRSH